MSKLNIDNVKKAIGSVLDGSKEKKRKFVETIELQIALKDYDTQRDKRFSGTVKLRTCRATGSRSACSVTRCTASRRSRPACRS